MRYENRHIDIDTDKSQTRAWACVFSCRVTDWVSVECDMSLTAPTTSSFTYSIIYWLVKVEAEVKAPTYEQTRQRTTSSTSSSSSAASLPGAPAATATSTSAAAGARDGRALAAASARRSVTERDGTQIFRISVDIGAEFGADELTVKSADRRLLIHARHDETVSGRTSRREFSREFDLPDAVDPASLTASMSTDGRLIVEAPIASYSQGAVTQAPGSTKRPEITVMITPWTM